jgi:hypothetical protein
MLLELYKFAYHSPRLKFYSVDVRGSGCPDEPLQYRLCAGLSTVKVVRAYAFGSRSTVTVTVAYLFYV